MSEDQKKTTTNSKPVAKKPAAKKPTTAAKKSTSKTSATKKSTTVKKPAAKKTSAKKTPTKKATNTKKKTTSSSKKPATKKTTTKKSTNNKKLTNTEKKTATKKEINKKITDTKEKSAVEVAKEAAKKIKTQKTKLNIKDKVFGLKDKLINKKKAPELVDVKKKKNYKKTRQEKAAEAWRRKLILRTIGVVATCVISFAVVYGIFTIFGKTQVNGGIACTVGESNVMEDKVTNYIKYNTYYSYYAKNPQQWSTMLSSYFGGTDKFREQVIEDKFIHDELVKQACEKEGIEVSDETIDEHVASLRNKYKSEDAYKNALSQKGETPESYRETVKQQEMEKQLKAKVCPEKDPTDQEVIDYIKENKTTYKDAKKSSHILFATSDQAKAQEVLDQINAGQIDFAAAAKQYSTDTSSAEKGGDVGWDKLNSFVSEYTTALKDLEPGKVSALVKSEYGYHIIKCTDKWSTPDDITTLVGIPQDIIDAAKSKKKETSNTEEFNTWLENFKSENNIKTNIWPTPPGLPYAATPTTGSKTSTTTTTTGSGK